MYKIDTDRYILSLQGVYLPRLDLQLSIICVADLELSVFLSSSYVLVETRYKGLIFPPSGYAVD